MRAFENENFPFVYIPVPRQRRLSNQRVKLTVRPVTVHAGHGPRQSAPQLTLNVSWKWNRQLILEFKSKGQFLTSLAALPFKGSYTVSDLLNDKFRIYRDAIVEIYYTPFDYIKNEAKLLIIGITPGWTQQVKSDSNRLEFYINCL